MPIKQTSLAGTTTVVPPAELRTYHRNPRRGDVAAIKRSLLAHDQYRPITVNVGSHTGRPNEVLAGNHTLLAIRELAAEHPDDVRWQAIKVHWGDWDDDQCKRIVLTDNRTAELGGYDNAELVALLNDLPEVDLSTIGYSVDDLTELEASLLDDEPGGRGTGDKAALWGATLGEPEIAPERGTIWQMGHHTVVVFSLHKEWASWVKLLKPGMMLAPYPSLLLPYMDVATETPMLMVQPDPYIAGWMMTKWNRLNPDNQVVQL